MNCTVTTRPRYSLETWGEYRIVKAVYPAGTRMSRHQDHAPRISIVIAGAVIESAEKTSQVGTATSMVVKPGHVWHENEFGPAGAAMLSILLPESEIPIPIAPDHWHWIHGGAPAVAAAELVRHFSRAPGETGWGGEEHVLQLLAAISATVQSGVSDCVTNDDILQIRDELAETFPQPRSVSEIAREAGYHPVYVSRLFRKRFGESITDFVRRRRVHAAADQLASSDSEIAQIALETGFSDQSHLCRHFRREMNTTPARFRLLSRTGAAKEAAIPL